MTDAKHPTIREHEIRVHSQKLAPILEYQHFPTGLAPQKARIRREDCLNGASSEQGKLLGRLWLRFVRQGVDIRKDGG